MKDKICEGCVYLREINNIPSFSGYYCDLSKGFLNVYYRYDIPSIQKTKPLYDDCKTLINR
jgi:hypothetical protein